MDSLTSTAATFAAISYGRLIRGPFGLTLKLS
jgi:hypothetical protein